MRDTFYRAGVVVHGSSHRLDADADARDEAVVSRAAALLRRIVPEALTTEDAVPFRTMLFRIPVGDMTGRAARSGRSATEPR